MQKHPPSFLTGRSPAGDEAILMGISGRTEGEGGNLGLRRRNCHPGIISFCQSYENVHGACRERKIFKNLDFQESLFEECEIHQSCEPWSKTAGQKYPSGHRAVRPSNRSSCCEGMKVRVRVPGGSTQKLDADPDDAVLSLLRRTIAASGLSSGGESTTAIFCLSLNKKTALDESASLRDCGVRGGDLLYMLGGAPLCPVNLVLCTHTRTKAPFEVSRKGTQSSPPAAGLLPLLHSSSSFSSSSSSSSSSCSFTIFL